MMRSLHRRNPLTEQLLVGAEEKRLQYDALLKKQFDAERLTLGFPDFDTEMSMKCDASSLDGGLSLTDSLSSHKKLKKISKANPPRPKKIYNKTSLIECIFDTSDFPICSTNSLKNSLKEGSLNSLNGGSSILTRSTNLSQVSKWHPEAVQLAHGEDPLSRSVSPISRQKNNR